MLCVLQRSCAGRVRRRAKEQRRAQAGERSVPPGNSDTDETDAAKACEEPHARRPVPLQDLGTPTAHDSTLKCRDMIGRRVTLELIYETAHTDHVLDSSDERLRFTLKNLPAECDHPLVDSYFNSVGMRDEDAHFRPHAFDQDLVRYVLFPPGLGVQADAKTAHAIGEIRSCPACALGTGTCQMNDLVPE
jgi:hypothetical protein